MDQNAVTHRQEYPPQAPQVAQERQTEAQTTSAYIQPSYTQPVPQGAPQGQTYQRLGQEMEEVQAVSVKAGDILTLSSGVKVRVKRVPPGLLQKLYARRGGEEPIPPMVEETDEATGRRYKVEDPEDPQYKRDLMAHRMSLGLTIKDLVLAVGLDIVQVPDGVPTLESTEWEERLAIIGEEVPETGVARRVAWFDAVAIESDADYNTIQAISSESMSVDQEEVREAQESFQGND